MAINFFETPLVKCQGCDGEFFCREWEEGLENFLCYPCWCKHRKKPRHQSQCEGCGEQFSYDGDRSQYYEVKDDVSFVGFSLVTLCDRCWMRLHCESCHKCEHLTRTPHLRPGPPKTPCFGCWARGGPGPRRLPFEAAAAKSDTGELKKGSGEGSGGGV